MYDSGVLQAPPLSTNHLALFPLPVVVYDAVDLAVLEANDLAARAFGRARREDLLGRPIMTAVEESERPHLRQRLVETADRPGSRDEWRMRRADGSRFEARTYSRAIEWAGRAACLIVIEDISEQKRLERTLRESEQQYRTAMGASQAGMFVLQAHRFRYVNPALCDWFGYAPEELVDNLGPLDLVAPEERDFVREETRRQAAGESGRPCELTGLRKDGSRFSIMILSAPAIWRGEPATVGTVLDLGAIKTAEARIRELAYYDALTGLANRGLLEDRVTQAVAYAERQDEPLALLFVDLDRFKNVNDSLGHVVGDGLLRAVARRLRKLVRDSDTVARPGGDEFILLANGCDPAAARTMAGKLLAAFAQPFHVEGRELTISPSIGIAMYPQDAPDFAGLLRCADIAMYQVKHAGRHGYGFYSPGMNAPIVESHLLETQLRRAIERGELSLAYQPLARVEDGRIVVAEALLRWHHPELGDVPPARFIPIAEESGLIVSLGEWVLEQAAAQARAWRDQGHHDLVISVNVSALEFQRGDVGDSVLGALDRHGLPGEALELELTESVLMADAERSVGAMKRLAERGVRVSVDDFGTGYSSLAYLTRLPISKLKIDRSFIGEITSDAGARSVARGIVGLGHSLGIAVVAEGVEAADQLALLREWSCDQVQGFHLSRPLPPDDFAALLRGSRGRPAAH